MLDKLGWNERLASLVPDDSQPVLRGRVCGQTGNFYNVLTEQGERLCSSGAAFGYAPAVGDWVLIEQQLDKELASISYVFERNSSFMQKAEGSKDPEEVVAANIDYAFLVMACDESFNLRRLERHITVAWDSGTSPVIVLTKADTIDQAERLSLEVQIESIAFGVPVYFVSNKTGENVAGLVELLKPNRTGALLGAPGAGKSALMGSFLKKTSSEFSPETQGKDVARLVQHDLILLPEGGVLIDTPGMRDFQTWTSGGLPESVEDFEDVEILAAACKFNDCSHTSEPGCAIKQALETGQLSELRYEEYVNLQQEESKQEPDDVVDDEEDWSKPGKNSRQKFKFAK